MKRLVLIILGASLFTVAKAQNNNVVSTINYLRDYDSGKNTDDLLEAKKYIDEASNNESTKGKPKTWVKRGDVYRRLNDTIKDPKVAALNIDALAETRRSYKEAITLITDKSSDFYKFSIDGMSYCARAYHNLGIVKNNSQDFAGSFICFQSKLEINNEAGFAIDTNIIYSAANIASKAKMNDKAKELYKKAIDLKYGTGYGEIEMVRPYYFLSQIYKAESNEAEYLGTLKTARQLFPNNKDLLNEELNYYVANGRLNEALKNIDESIAKDPTNKSSYLNKSIIYENLANPKDKKIDLKAFEEYTAKAIEAATKAIEIDANYYDGIFQLGALYYNKGVSQNEYANTITGSSPAEMKKYEAETKKVDESFKKAIPNFEKCETIGNSDKEALKQLYLSMKQIYQFIEQPEKVKAMKAKLDAL
jgi:tetratricopeptide (TPR) repeat protein